MILAIGQENAFPWIERDLGIEFDKWDMPVSRREDDAVSRAPASSSAATRLGDRRTSSGPSSTAIRPPSPFTIICQGIPVTERPPVGMNLISQKMGISEWSYHNDYNPAARQKMTHVDLTRALRAAEHRSGTRFTAEQTAREVQRCLNCDVQTVFTAAKCIECDACIDICPVQCLTITRNGDEHELRHAPVRAGGQSRIRILRLRSAAADRRASW